MPPSVRVLVIDDSPICRAALCGALEDDGDIEVVGEAADGVEAIEKVEELSPSLVTVDLTMPRLSGLEFLDWLSRHRPTPALVVTERPRDEQVEEAFATFGLGALDLLPKAASYVPGSPAAQALVQKVKSLASVRIRRDRAPPTGLPSWLIEGVVLQIDVVGVGASTGGPNALAELLGGLPADFGPTVLIVQHIDAQFSDSLVSWLSRRSKLPVKLAHDGEILPRGEVRVGRQGRDLVVESGQIRLMPAKAGSLHVPSADSLLLSLADEYGSRAAGVLLSGMGEDGAKGLLTLHHRGGLTLAQDRESSIVWGMPGAAVEMGAAEMLLPPEAMGAFLSRAATTPRSVRPETRVRSKVLVVDDSEIVRETTRMILEKNGFEVVTTDNALGVARLMRLERPDVVLMDVRMPALSGDVATQVVSQRTQTRTPVLLFSDLPSEELAVMAVRCGAAGWVKKGDERGLVRQLRAVVDVS